MAAEHHQFSMPNEVRNHSLYMILFPHTCFKVMTFGECSWLVIYFVTCEAGIRALRQNSTCRKAQLRAAASSVFCLHSIDCQPFLSRKFHFPHTLKMPATTADTLSLVTRNVSVAPLVLLSVADHYGRSAKGTRKRVVGVLLGQNDGKNVRVSNSFAGSSAL